MNLRRHATPQHPGIQLAPLVDVLLLLLIFFLMTWNAARNENELDVKVPKANLVGTLHPAAARGNGGPAAVHRERRLLLLFGEKRGHFAARAEGVHHLGPEREG